MVYVLGMTNGHNSTVALMRDGIVVACASEERFLRKKNFYGYPEKAIEYCLKEAKIDSSFLDKVDARHTLRNSDLQYLNLGNYLVWKK